MNVIITGASKGMGRKIAEKFAANNHNLFLCARSEVQLYKTVEELLLMYPGVTIKAMPADLGERAEVAKFGEWVLAQTARIEEGKPDILVNNAGQFIPGSIHSEDEGVLETLMQVNLLSAYHLTRLLLPPMMERKSGHIFNMCSIASLNAYKNGGAYSISKYALLGFSKNLREEMKEFGIKVTAVMPGAVYTDSWSGTGVSPQRIMESEDIAELVFAASQLSAQAVVEEIVVRPQLGDL
jgi:short-subunit dehydrogenase